MNDIVQKTFNNDAQKYKDFAFLESLGLKHLSNIETNFIKTHVKDIGPNLVYLDLGIGTGRNSQILLQKKLKVTGLDFSEKMLNEVRSNLREYVKIRVLHLHRHNLNNKLPYPNDTFDGLICIRVMKYVQNWKKLIKEMGRVSKPNSILIFDIANLYSIQTISQFYNIYFTLNPKEVEGELKSAGFRVIEKKFGAKLPFMLYKRIHFHKNLKKIVDTENFLSSILGSFLSRNILFYCRKQT